MKQLTIVTIRGAIIFLLNNYFVANIVTKMFFNLQRFATANQRVQFYSSLPISVNIGALAVGQDPRNALGR